MGEARVKYSPNMGIWVSAGGMEWNAFGVEDIPSMVVQLNFQNYVTESGALGPPSPLTKPATPLWCIAGTLGVEGQALA